MRKYKWLAWILIFSVLCSYLPEKPLADVINVDQTIYQEDSEEESVGSVFQDSDINAVQETAVVDEDRETDLINEEGYFEQEATEEIFNSTASQAVTLSEAKDYVSRIANADVRNSFYSLFNEFPPNKDGSTKIYNETTGSYWTDKINSKITRGTKCGGAWQCFGFALYSYAYMFHCLGSNANTSDNTMLLQSATSVSYGSFTNAGIQPGAHIRCVSSGNTGHSMILVYYDAEIIVVYHANGDGYGTVYTGRYTWSQFNSAQLGGHSPARHIYYIAMPRGNVADNCSDSYAGTYVCTTSGTNLNIRPNHDGTGDPIGRIPFGAELTVSKANGSWAHVTYGGVSGFASMQYLTRKTDNPGGGSNNQPSPPVPTNPAADIPQGTPMAQGFGQTIPDGDYYIVSYGNPGFQIDISGADFPALEYTNVQLWETSDEDRFFDAFTIKYDPSDQCYTILQRGTNISLNVDNAGMAMMTNIKTLAFNGSSAQKWAIAPAWGNGSFLGYRIVSKCNSFAVDIQDGLYQNTRNIWLWEGNNTLAQSWMLIPYRPSHTLANGRYILVSGVNTDYELDVIGSTYNVSAGTNVQIYNDSTPDFTENSVSKYNMFDVSSGENGYYRLLHVGSGKALEVENSERGLYANVRLGDNNSSNSGQDWAITPHGNGYELRARCSGLALDVSGGVAANNTNVQQVNSNGTNAQKWFFVPAEYKVKYDSNGGNAAPTDQIKYYKGKLFLSETVPVRTGFTFVGWNTKMDGTGEWYSAGGVYNTDISQTLYAQWTQKTYTVTYNTNGGTGAPESDTKTYGEEHTLSSIVPTRQGYTFKGWNTMPDGNGTSYHPSVAYTLNEDMLLYAQWEAIASPVLETNATITVGSKNVSAGEEFSIPIIFKDNPGVVSVEISVEYDESLIEWIEVEAGAFGGQFDGIVGGTITWYSSNPKIEINGDTDFAILKFRVADNVKEGTAYVTISYDKENVFNSNEENVAFNIEPGQITIRSYIPGDINGDGNLNNKDVTRLMRYNKYHDIYVVEATLDVNGDGNINNKDVTRLMRYLKYGDVEIF